ncbi:MAG TPA: response regulator, partial [Azospira sp.]|nr:response regulator [Azospira sp.]
MRILIVDDSAGIGKVLTALCVSAGHEVVATLADGSDIEAQLARLRPDLVCLDYHLPGRDGLALLAAIQAQAPEIAVVFMTGSEETGIEQRAADAGAAGFLRKPFTQAQVLGELRAVGESRAVPGPLEEAPAADAAATANVAETATATATERGAGDGGAVSSGGRRTVVVADDSASVRLVLKRLLEECGLSVVKSVGNGSEAIQAVRNLRPAILCLDVNMPVIGGL